MCPLHRHLRGTTNQATSGTPVGNVLRQTRHAAALAAFAQPTSGVIPAGAVSVGGGQAHNNMQPFLTLQFAIALIGIFPSQNPN